MPQKNETLCRYVKVRRRNTLSFWFLMFAFANAAPQSPDRFVDKLVKGIELHVASRNDSDRYFAVKDTFIHFDEALMKASFRDESNVEAVANALLIHPNEDVAEILEAVLRLYRPFLSQDLSGSVRAGLISKLNSAPDQRRARGAAAALRINHPKSQERSLSEFNSLDWETPEQKLIAGQYLLRTGGSLPPTEIQQLKARLNQAGANQAALLLIEAKEFSPEVMSYVEQVLREAVLDYYNKRDGATAIVQALIAHNPEWAPARVIDMLKSKRHSPILADLIISAAAENPYFHESGGSRALVDATVTTLSQYPSNYLTLSTHRLGGASQLIYSLAYLLDRSESTESLIDFYERYETQDAVSIAALLALENKPDSFDKLNSILADNPERFSVLELYYGWRYLSRYLESDLPTNPAFHTALFRLANHYGKEANRPKGVIPRDLFLVLAKRHTFWKGKTLPAGFGAALEGNMSKSFLSEMVSSLADSTSSKSEDPRWQSDPGALKESIELLLQNDGLSWGQETRIIESLRRLCDARPTTCHAQDLAKWSQAPFPPVLRVWATTKRNELSPNDSSAHQHLAKAISLEPRVLLELEKLDSVAPPQVYLETLEHMQRQRVLSAPAIDGCQAVCKVYTRVKSRLRSRAELVYPGSSDEYTRAINILRSHFILKTSDLCEPSFASELRQNPTILLDTNEVLSSIEKTHAGKPDGVGNYTLWSQIFLKQYLDELVSRAAQEQKKQELMPRSKKIQEMLSNDINRANENTSESGSGSVFNTFALGAATSSSHPTVSTGTKQLNQLVDAGIDPLVLPYSPTKYSSRASQRDSAARNITVHLALCLNDSQKCPTLVRALETYKEHLPSLTAHVLRGPEGGWHGDALARDSIAPYYFYSSAPYATSAIRMLLGRTDLPESDRKKLLEVRESIKQTLISLFDQNKSGFQPEGSNDATSSYIDPLAGLALASTLDECQGKKIDILGLIAKPEPTNRPKLVEETTPAKEKPHTGRD